MTATIVPLGRTYDEDQLAYEYAARRLDNAHPTYGQGCQEGEVINFAAARAAIVARMERLAK